MNMTNESSRAEAVSVIIPAYKAEQTIRRAVDSVLAQTVPPAEIIIVDDGSPDHQCTAIEEYGNRVLLVRQANGGTAMARNAGLARAQGDFIAFLDADDYWEPEKLERQLTIFAKHRSVGVVGGAYFVQEPGGTRTAVGCHDRWWNDRVLGVRGERAFRLATMIWTGTLMVRRSILGEELFVPGLEPAEDRDMWMRLVLRAPVYMLSVPLATAVLEPGSLSRTNLGRDCAKMLEVIQRHQKSIGPVGMMVWRSHTLYRWAGMNSSPRTAITMLLHSFVWWPLPYRGLRGMLRLGRAKRLIVLLMLAVRLRSSETEYG